VIAPLLDLQRLSVIAHRGGSKLRPENTLAAFEHAVALGVDALECDVHLSRDGEVVVIHDPTLERTTDARGPVAALTASELARVDAGFQFGAAEGFPFRGRAGGIPTLHDVLGRHRDRPVVIEVKGENVETARRALGVVREHDAGHRVIVGGFSPAVLGAVRREMPTLVTSANRAEGRQALTRSYLWLSPRRPAFQLFQMPFRLQGRQIFGRGFVSAARRGGLPVHAWIVDDPADMRRLIVWGVTGIISDRPDLAMDVIAALSGSRPPPAAP
jgi:glycerophosphoryl diester phosphodiesterase